MWRDVSTIGCSEVGDDIWSCDVFERGDLDDYPDDPAYYDVPDAGDTVTVEGGEVFDSDSGDRSGNIDEVYFNDDDGYDVTFRMGPGTKCGLHDHRILVCRGRYGD